MFSVGFNVLLCCTYLDRPLATSVLSWEWLKECVTEACQQSYPTALRYAY